MLGSQDKHELVYLSFVEGEGGISYLNLGLHLMQDNHVPVGINCSWLCQVYSLTCLQLNSFFMYLNNFSGLILHFCPGVFSLSRVLCLLVP